MHPVPYVLPYAKTGDKCDSETSKRGEDAVRKAVGVVRETHITAASREAVDHSRSSSFQSTSPTNSVKSAWAHFAHCSLDILVDRFRITYVSMTLGCGTSFGAGEFEAATSRVKGRILRICQTKPIASKIRIDAAERYHLKDPSGVLGKNIVAWFGLVRLISS